LQESDDHSAEAGVTPRRFLNMAKAFTASLDRLEENAQDHLSGLFLAGQALETGLKAYLLLVGWKDDDVKDLSHDLERAWEAAAKEGLSIEHAVPDWCKTLNALHNWPYQLRYPRVDGYIAASPGVYALHLDELLDKVERAIREE
jgi:HEPN domain